MKKVDLLVVEVAPCYEYHRIRVNVQTARGLLRKAYDLAFNYKFYYYFRWQYAEVYLYNPRKIPEPIKRKDLLKLEPLAYQLDTLKKLYNVGGYSQIVKAVKKVQGIKLREGRDRKKNKKIEKTP